MEILGKQLTWLFSLAWRKGWPGWLAASTVAVAGGMSLVVALIGLIVASATDDWSSPIVYWALILAIIGLLPLACRQCLIFRRRHVAGHDASRDPRDRDDGDSVPPG